MNIFYQEMKFYLRSVGIWSLAIFLILLVYLSAFGSIAEEAEELARMMDSFPEELLIAFGMNDMDLSSVLGFYGVVFLFCQVCLAIQASNYGFGLVSIEERELTADFLLAKPVSRAKILTSKLLAALLSLTMTNLSVWLSSYLVLELVRDGREYDTTNLMFLLLSIVIFQLVFFGLGLFISLLVRRVRSVTPFSLALAFGMYVLNAFGNMIGDDTLELVSPFRHFEPNFILRQGAYDFPLVWISIGLILISLPASYFLYRRRDMAAAV